MLCLPYPKSVTENHRLSNLNQGFQTIHRKLSSEHERVGRIGNPQLVYELRRDLIRTVQIGVAIKIASPINPSEGIVGAAQGIFHRQECRKVMLLRVTGVSVEAR